MYLSKIKKIFKSISVITNDIFLILQTILSPIIITFLFYTVALIFCLRQCQARQLCMYM